MPNSAILTTSFEGMTGCTDFKQSSDWGYFGGSNPFLRYIFQVDIILEKARSSGLAGIIFHLRLEGKKRIRMSCFLLVLIYVKLGILL